MSIPPNSIIQGKCEEVLKDVESGSVDLVATDPPFNIGYKYDVYEDKLDYNKYLDWTRVWVGECHRVLKPNGSIYVAIGDEYAAELNVILKETGFHFRNWIVWHYRFGQHCSKKYGRCHTHIHYFSKDPVDFTFNPDAIRVASARQSYGDKRANPKGKIPSDVWQEAETDDVWTVSRVCGNFKERLEHGCQMPEKILERVILASSNEGDLVLDPFSGSFTTCAVAKKLGRRYIGIELSENHVGLGKRRLDSIQGDCFS